MRLLMSINDNRPLSTLLLIGSYLRKAFTDRALVFVPTATLLALASSSRLLTICDSPKLFATEFAVRVMLEITFGAPVPVTVPLIVPGFVATLVKFEGWVCVIV